MARPRAVSATPIHSRRVIVKPNNLSATTVSSARPPAITDCTRLIGARARPATWKPQPAIATRMPSVHQRLENRATVDFTGWRSSTGGADAAPRCLNRKPRICTNAQARAKSSPTWTDSGTQVQLRERRTSHARAAVQLLFVVAPHPARREQRPARLHRGAHALDPAARQAVGAVVVEARHDLLLEQAVQLGGVRVVLVAVVV